MTKTREEMIQALTNLWAFGQEWPTEPTKEEQAQYARDLEEETDEDLAFMLKYSS